MATTAAAPLTSPTDRVRDLVAAALIAFAKVLTNFRCTSETQRMIIGRAVTGLDVRKGLHRSASPRRLTSVGLPLIFLA
jgi:hypothetical protein